MYNGKSNMCQNYNNDSIDSPLDKTAVILFGIDNIKKKGNNPELKNIKNNITIDQLKPFILPEPSIKWVLPPLPHLSCCASSLASPLLDLLWRGPLSPSHNPYGY